MAIKISLPKPLEYDGEYKGIKSFLKQLELCVHHCQKALEEMEKNGELGSDSFVVYRFPSLDIQGRKQDANGNVLVHVDEESESMQEIEIEIHA